MSTSSTTLTPKRPINPVTWVLLWCSGVKRDVLRRCDSETSNFVGLGGAVLTTATFASLSSTAALAMALHKPVTRMLPFGIAWGLAILNLDRWIVSTGVGRSVWTKLANLIARLALALLVSFVITEPLLLTVFDPEIQAQVMKLQTQDRTAQNTRLDAEYAPQLAAVDQRISDLQQQLTDEDAKVAGLYQKAVCEARGQCGTNLVGLGKFFNEDWTAYRSEVARRAQLRSDLGGRIKKLEGRSQGLGHQRDLAKARSGDTVSNDSGILQRVKALSLLTRDNRDVGIAAWLLRGIIIMIEILPVVLKLQRSLDPSNPYEKVLALEVGLDVDREQRRWQATIDDRVAEEAVRNAERDTWRDIGLKRDAKRRQRLGLDEPLPVWVQEQDGDGLAADGHAGGDGGLDGFVSNIIDYEQVRVPLDPRLTRATRIGALILAGMIPYLLIGWAADTPGATRPSFVHLGWPLLHWTLWVGGHELLGLSLALLATAAAALLAIWTRAFTRAPRLGHLAAVAVAGAGIACALLPITAVTLLILNATLSIFR